MEKKSTALAPSEAGTMPGRDLHNEWLHAFAMTMSYSWRDTSYMGIRVSKSRTCHWSPFSLTRDSYSIRRSVLAIYTASKQRQYTKLISTQTNAELFYQCNSFKKAMWWQQPTRKRHQRYTVSQRNPCKVDKVERSRGGDDMYIGSGCACKQAKVVRILQGRFPCPGSALHREN